MSLIDTSYFVTEKNIPNTGEAAVLETLTWFINKYEQEFLEKFMGYALYKAYKASPTEQRFKDIIEGKEFTNFQGSLAKWKGLIDAVVPNPTAPATTPIGQKQSIIANYVYYWYRRMNVTQSTGAGEVLLNAENSMNISPKKKMVSAWNEIHIAAHVFYEFMQQNETVYPEWTNNDGINMLNHFAFINPFF